MIRTLKKVQQKAISRSLRNGETAAAGTCFLYENLMKKPEKLLSHKAR